MKGKDVPRTIAKDEQKPTELKAETIRNDVNATELEPEIQHMPVNMEEVDESEITDESSLLSWGDSSTDLEDQRNVEYVTDMAMEKALEKLEPHIISQKSCIEQLTSDINGMKNHITSFFSSSNR